MCAATCNANNVAMHTSVLKCHVCLAGHLQSRPRAIARREKKKQQHYTLKINFHHLQGSQF